MTDAVRARYERFAREEAPGRSEMYTEWASGVAAAAVGIYYMVRYRGMRLAIAERRLRFTFAQPSRGMAVAEMRGDEASAEKA